MYKRNQSVRLRKEIQANKRAINQLHKTAQMQGKKLVSLEKKCNELDAIIHEKLDDTMGKVKHILELVLEIWEEMDIDVEGDSISDD